MNRTLVIDCNNLCYSALFTFGELSHEEKKTGVIFGFLQRILFLANKFETNKFIFCWDSKKNYRKLIYPEYKANRRKDLTEQEEIDYALAFKQFDVLREKVLPGLGFSNVFQQNGYEADDLIAEVVKRGGGSFGVVSTDKDLYQLLDRCSIYNQRTKKVITHKDFQELYGIPCTLWADVKALMGDSGDNISGIVGVGEKKAIQFITNILPKGKIFDLILSLESQDTFLRNLKLIELPYHGIKKIKMIMGEDEFDKFKFIDVFMDYGFESFLRKDTLNKWVDLMVRTSI